MNLGHHLVDVISEFVDVDPFLCGNEYARRLVLSYPAVLQLSQ